MRRYDHEPLRKHTTLRIGGPAQTLLVPESPEELMDAVRRCQAKRLTYTVLGRGSNVLAADGPINRVIIKNTEACRQLHLMGDGVVEAGASVLLQEFIRFCLDHDLHGMEYLYSVPGNIGGGVYMNAGRGRSYGMAISDCLESVEVFDGKRSFRVEKPACRFRYRSSIFQRKPAWTILGARFRLPPQPKAEGLRRIEERMAWVRQAQDHSHPNAGTVFKDRFQYGYAFRGKRINGAQFSGKTGNWMLNVNHATSRDVTRLIAMVRRHHLMRGQWPPVLEWVTVR